MMNFSIEFDSNFVFYLVINLYFYIGIMLSSKERYIILFIMKNTVYLSGIIFIFLSFSLFLVV